MKRGREGGREGAKAQGVTESAPPRPDEKVTTDACMASLNTKKPSRMLTQVPLLPPTPFSASPPPASPSHSTCTRTVHSEPSSRAVPAHIRNNPSSLHSSTEPRMHRRAQQFPNNFLPSYIYTRVYVCVCVRARSRVVCVCVCVRARARGERALTLCEERWSSPCDRGLLM